MKERSFFGGGLLILLEKAEVGRESRGSTAPSETGCSMLIAAEGQTGEAVPMMGFLVLGM